MEHTLAARERPMEKQRAAGDTFIVSETVRTGVKGRALVMSTTVAERCLVKICSFREGGSRVADPSPQRTGQGMKS